ncbi:carboxypeptidase B-like [Lampetra fluviatilis]
MAPLRPAALILRLSQLLLLLLGLTWALPGPSQEDFRGNQVLSLTLTSQAQLFALQQLDQVVQLDFWQPESASQLRLGEEVHLHVPSASGSRVAEWLAQHGVTHRLLIQDVAERVRSQFDGASSSSLARGAHSYEKYHTLDEIYQWTSNMVAQYPDLVTKTEIGTSSEGRSIPMLTISRKTGASKKGFFVDCGIHAREWISTAFCQWFVKELVEGYGSSETLTRLVDEMDVFVVPVINVDGYAFTWSKDRMWRKTRSHNPGSACIGTDPNRNWDSNWCVEGASPNPCAETFCGSSAESEPEVKAVADFLRGRSSTIVAYLSMHAYSQLLLLPYAGSYQQSEHNNELSSLAKRATKALSSAYGTKYRYGPASTTIYLASGGSFDWAYDQGIRYSMTFELRDTGRHGFLLPESQIRATCEETMLAYEVIVQHVLDHPY